MLTVQRTLGLFLNKLGITNKMTSNDLISRANLL